MWQFPQDKISAFSAERMQARCCVLEVQNLAKKHTEFIIQSED